MDSPRPSKKPSQSTDLLNIPSKAAAPPSILVLNKKKSPHIYRVGDSKSIAGVKRFLDGAIRRDQSADDLNVEVVSEGEPYIEMTLGLVPLEEVDNDELSDRSDSESSETSCEELKLPDGICLPKQNTNSKLLIEEIENK